MDIIYTETSISRKSRHKYQAQKFASNIKKFLVQEENQNQNLC